MDRQDAAAPLSPPLPTSVTGHWIILRPISQDDYLTFFRWRADLLELHLWSSPRRVPTWEEFRAEMEQITRQSVTFLVVIKGTDEPIGFVQAYNLNLAEGWCFTSEYIVPRYRRGAQAGEAYIALLEYLFRSFPLRKVYADVYEFNIEPLRPLMAGGFVEEGRFRQHTWYNDRYWDVIRLAMYRERWLEVRDRARLLLGVSEAAADLVAEQQALRQTQGGAQRDGGNVEPRT